MTDGTNERPPNSAIPFEKVPDEKTTPPAIGAHANLRATQRNLVMPDQRDRALLIRTDACNTGEVIKVEGNCFNLGRHPDNNACIDHDGISRFHARVTTEKGQYWLQDLDSSNGTYINGRRITSCELNNGDTLNLGPRVQFRFSAATEGEERVLKKLYESSVRDPLTGAFNRHYFDAQFDSELPYAARHGSPLSIILLDIDFFKKVNDTHGHPGGDASLQHLVRVFQETLRAEDLLARYGGEEFIILLRGIPLAAAVAVAERLRNLLLSNEVAFGDVRIALTASFGCASMTCVEAPSPQSLIALADRRLYQAKAAGRNQVVSTGV